MNRTTPTTRAAPARAETLEPRRLMAGIPSWGLSVHVRVFEDLDGNGKRSRNEPGVPGVRILNTLLPSHELKGPTWEDGRWSYFSIGGAPVVLQAVPPEGLHFSPGEDGTRAASYPGRGPGTVVRRLRPIALTRAGGITGSVFHDSNADDLPDPDARGARGWRVFIDLNRDDVRQRNEPLAKTDVNGDWRFGGLGQGNYRVRIAGRRGYDVSRRNIDVELAQGQIAEDVLFGVRRFRPGVIESRGV